MRSHTSEESLSVALSSIIACTPTVQGVFFANTCDILPHRKTSSFQTYIIGRNAFCSISGVSGRVFGPVCIRTAVNTLKMAQLIH